MVRQLNSTSVRNWLMLSAVYLTDCYYCHCHHRWQWRWWWLQQQNVLLK